MTAAIKAPKDHFEYMIPNSGFSKNNRLTVTYIPEIKAIETALFSKNNRLTVTPNSQKNFWQPKVEQFTKNYTFKGSSLGDIPDDLLYLLEAIEKSKYILDLQDDWDDEGSEGYEELSWVASAKFILNYAKTLYDDFNVKIDIPKIYEGPKGSIDVIWETPKYRLVVNIDKNGEDAMFYADNYNNQTTEGIFKLNSFNRSLLPIALQF